jgi:ribosomal protein S8
VNLSFGNTNSSVYDLLSRLKTGAMKKSKNIVVPYSVINGTLLGKLYEKGLLANFYFESYLYAFVVTLKYDMSGKCLLSSLQCYSSPSRRVFLKRREIVSLDKTFWFLFCTESGFYFDDELKTLARGGELLFKLLR